MAKEKRAARGSVGEKVLLRMPPELRDHAERSAKKEGITLAEWIRRAIRDRALRQSVG